MKFDRNRLATIFFIFMIAWYLITFLIPYNTVANSLGIIDLGKRHSWPISFFVMDSLVLALTGIFSVILIRAIKSKDYLWILSGILLLYPLLTVWASLQDLIVSPIAP